MEGRSRVFWVVALLIVFLGGYLYYTEIYLKHPAEINLELPSKTSVGKKFSVPLYISTGKSANSSFVVRIDTVAPTKPEVQVDTKNGTNQFPVFNIKSSDKGSGIDYFLISIDGREPIKTKDSSHKLDKQLPGNHSYSVIAVDKAGNKSPETTGKLFIEGVEGPTITDSPTFVAMLQPIKLTGKALYGSTVQLYVDDKQVAEFYVSEYLSDRQQRSGGLSAAEEVEWSYEIKNNFSSGVINIYATQTTSEGRDSFKSNTVNVRILSGWISLGGIIIPIPVLFWISIIIIILIVALLLFIWKKYVLSWRNRLKNLQDEVDSEMANLIDEAPAENEEITATKNKIDDDFAGASK